MSPTLSSADPYCVRGHSSGGKMNVIELRGLIQELTAQYQVPGASIAVLEKDVVTEAATGVLSMSTGVEVTPDSLFQIASIGKMWNATLVMQLVDEGKVELNSPVRAYLPELQFADRQATDLITVKHLLCHTGGIDGEHYADTGRGNDCYEKFVATCTVIPQLAAPGSFFSYARAGSVVLGRMIEKVTGLDWDTALRERLICPLGARRTVSLPEEAILHRVAVGHDPTASGGLAPVTVWQQPRSTGPAGGISTTTAELLSFARMHLDDGVAPNGTRVLSKKSVRAMQTPQVKSPDPWMFPMCGISWMLFDWDGKRVIGHDGGSAGQVSSLRIVPEHRFAVAVFTNSSTGTRFLRTAIARVFAERLGIKMSPEPQAAEGIEFDPARYVGTYRNLVQQIRIEEDEGALVARVASVIYGQPGPAIGGALKQIDEKSFLMPMPPADELPMVFFGADESGQTRYIHSGACASRRVD